MNSIIIMRIKKGENMKNKDIDYYITKAEIIDLKLSTINMLSCVEINDYKGVERDLDTLIKDAICLKNYLDDEEKIHYCLGSIKKKNNT